MAYVSQEDKAKLSPVVKAVLKKHGMKGSIAIRHHSTLVVNIRSGIIDFPADRDYIQVNPYWLEDHYTGAALAFLTELKAAMQGPDFFDRSDVMTDYFDVSHYINVNIGQWDKPYVFTGVTV
jgi:hypothetical protein